VTRLRPLDRLKSEPGCDVRHRSGWYRRHGPVIRRPVGHSLHFPVRVVWRPEAPVGSRSKCPRTIVSAPAAHYGHAHLHDVGIPATRRGLPAIECGDAPETCHLPPFIRILRRTRSAASDTSKTIAGMDVGRVLSDPALRGTAEAACVQPASRRSVCLSATSRLGARRLGRTAF